MDLSHAVYRTVCMNKEQITQNPNFVNHIVVSQILGFANKFGASKKNRMVVAMDSPSWRIQYYDINKAKFPEMAEMKYKGGRVKDGSIDWNLVFEKVDEVAVALQNYSDFHIMKVAGAEADDIISVLTRKFKPTEIIWICASDKDFIQEQDEPQVNIYDPIKQTFKPKHDVELFKKIHTIIGDDSDNIPAIKPRTKEKTAIKLLPELDTLLKTDPVMRAKWEFNENLIIFDKIPENVRESILDEYSKMGYNYNGLKLLSEFSKMKLTKHSEDINKFKLADGAVKTKLNQFFITAKKNKEASDRSLEDFFN